MIDELLSAGVEIRGCKKTQVYSEKIHSATDEDYRTEFLELHLQEENRCSVTYHTNK